MTADNISDDSGTAAPQVTVIIVNYNAGAWLQRCLEALRRQTYRRFEVIVVDNASHDESLAQAAACLDAHRVRLDRAEANLGFAAANNRAVGQSDSEWVALLNPDAFPEPDWLERMIAATQRHPAVDMFGSAQFAALEDGRLDGAGDQYFCAGLPWRGGYGAPVTALPDEGEVFAPCAAAALYRRAAFVAAGGFDERFFCYVEDVDLAFRLRLSGARCIQLRDAVVRHVGGGSGGDGASGFARYHGTRNLIWTFVKCMPGALFWPLLPMHMACIAGLCLLALLRGRPGPVWRGVGAALTGLGPVLAQRRGLQRVRRVPVRNIARALCWSLPRYLRRAAFTRPL